MVGMKTGTGGTPSDWDGFTDSQSTNFSDRNVREYTDLDLFFGKGMTSKAVSYTHLTLPTICSV